MTGRAGPGSLSHLKAGAVGTPPCPTHLALGHLPFPLPSSCCQSPLLPIVPSPCAGLSFLTVAPQRDGNGKLGLVEFNILWNRIRNYLVGGPSLLCGLSPRRVCCGLPDRLRGLGPPPWVCRSRPQPPAHLSGLCPPPAAAPHPGVGRKGWVPPSAWPSPSVPHSSPSSGSLTWTSRAA